MEDVFPASLQIQEIVEYGADRQRGNLLGIQPFMVPMDYASEERFYAKLEALLDVAGRRGWVGERTVVVFPEYVGTWLVAAGEVPRVYRAESVDRAMRALVLRHLVSFVGALPSAFGRAKDVVKYSLFRMQAARMAGIYHRVFSGLARKYGATIVAGSIVLPSPEVRDGALMVGRMSSIRGGVLYNVSVVYRPDGSAYEDVVRKVFPIDVEQPFIARGAAADVPVFDTPAGRLGVLICADAWYPATYGVMRAKGAEFVAVPSYLSPDGVWGAPWRGYDGAPAPDDVDVRDVKRITEGEAWLKYGMAGRMAGAGVQHGINVFLRGDVWDLGADGHMIVVRGQTVVEASHVTGAAIVNSWL